MTFKKIIYSLIPVLLVNYSLSAKIIENAEIAFKITLVKPPTSMPQTVAYIPVEKKY